jgi:hypothetical protein
MNQKNKHFHIYIKKDQHLEDIDIEAPSIEDAINTAKHDIDTGEETSFIIVSED